MDTTAEVKTVNLQHPLLNVPAIAVQVGYYFNDIGRAIGLELQFPDGHRAKLKYHEIRRLQRGEGD